MKKKNGSMRTTILVKVSAGMFSSERGVEFELPDGRKISAFVDKSQVIIEREPSPGGEVIGRLMVDVLEYDNDSAIVDLPQPALTVGPRIRVPRELVEEVPA